jgi:hypothetical protein
VPRALFTAICGCLLLATNSEAQTSQAASPIVARLSVFVSCDPAYLGSLDARPAAAVIFGFRGDTLLAVTADHAIRPVDPDCHVRQISLVTQEPFAVVEARIRPERDTNNDVAIIGAVLPGGRSRWAGLRRLAGIKAQPSTLYLLGCPASGSCFDDPLQVRVRRWDPDVIVVQTPFLEEGYSGGPAVDGSGQLIGMTIDYNGQYGRVRPWPLIESWLGQVGYARNLPTRPIDALSDQIISASVNLAPAVPVNPDGSRLFGSGNLRVEWWDSVGVGSVYGLDRVAIVLNQACASCIDERTVIGLAGYLISMGTGYAPRNKAFRLVGQLPMSGGFLGSIIFGASRQLESRNTPDSVNFSTGLPYREYFTFGYQYLFGFRLEAVFYLAVSNRLGIRSALQYTELAGISSSFGSSSTRFSGLTVGAFFRR